MSDGVDGDVGRLEVTNLTDHDDIRCLPQDRSKRRRERHADLGIDLHLVDAAHLVFDRIFDRDDLWSGLLM